MFTGIIQGVGTVRSIEPRGGDVTMTFDTGAVSLALGARHACALLGGASVRCWGLKLDGQLGNGGKLSSPVPTAVSGF